MRLFVLNGAICLSLCGCALEGAPTYDMFGAHFPAWLLCGAIGIVTALVFRGAVIGLGLDDVMPLRLLTYTAFGLASSVWLWLGLFGER
jgi:hypothetical protein